MHTPTQSHTRTHGGPRLVPAGRLGRCAVCRGPELAGGCGSGGWDRWTKPEHHCIAVLLYGRHRQLAGQALHLQGRRERRGRRREGARVGRRGRRRQGHTASAGAHSFSRPAQLAKVAGAAAAPTPPGRRPRTSPSREHEPPPQPAPNQPCCCCRIPPPSPCPPHPLLPPAHSPPPPPTLSWSSISISFASILQQQAGRQQRGHH